MATKLLKLDNGYEVHLGMQRIGMVEPVHPPLIATGRWAGAEGRVKRNPEWIARDPELRPIGQSMTRRMAIELVRNHYRSLYA